MNIVISKPDKNKTRQKRHLRVRGKISGTAKCPRLNVYRSNKNIYAQVIDDVAGVTLVSASTLDSEVNGGTKTEQAASVGEVVAKRAAEKSIKEVVFDRGGDLYHGRIEALAESARKNGLDF
ncbi:50S ribosomal protein L18 [Liquorilactobacillus uvarum]|uniref:50S ribosomal protein L18 n=1 Tax=Liquorilactobacillus uvarum TaxID=303240 RepID=UPI0007104D43|nr:50S ribosomal protein L18 [Liquorilactobacillus uvarum]